MSTSTIALVVLLTILALIDISSIIYGYFPCDNYFYWLSDMNSGAVPLFKEDLSVFFNKDIEVLRNLILTIVYFDASLTASSLLGLAHFIKRRFVASNWPLALWKLSTVVLGFRLLMVTWIVKKFHFVLLKDILVEFEDVNDKDADGYDYSLLNLYINGTIGWIPASLILSIALNVAILIVSISIIVKTEAWRRLNIKKRIY